MAPDSSSPLLVQLSTNTTFPHSATASFRTYGLPRPSCLLCSPTNNQSIDVLSASCAQCRLDWVEFTAAGTVDVPSCSQGATLFPQTTPSVPPTTACCLIPGLPNDVAVLCLARLPRTCLLSSRLVSQAWRKALEDPQFFDIRSSLGCSESWVYVESWNAVSKEVSWFAFDCRSRKWLALPPVPRKGNISSEVFGREAATLKGELWVVGGKAGISGPTLRDVYIYSPLCNRWRTGKSMIDTRHNPVVTTAENKLYVLGGFDCFDKPVRAAERFDLEEEAWTSIQIQGHPEFAPPNWYQKGWDTPWMSIPLDYGFFVLCYEPEDVRPGPGRPVVKYYESQEGAWEVKPHRTRALLRYGLSTVMNGKLYTIDWAAGRVRIADEACYIWVYVRGLENLPWVAILMANPRMAGVGSTIYIVMRGFNVLIIEMVEEMFGEAQWKHSEVRSQPDWADHEIIKCLCLCV